MRYPNKYCILGGTPNDDGGVFKIPFNGFDGVELYCIASHGGGWEHVSVSVPNRCPTWQEMCFIKDLFFEAEDCVIQYHPPKSDYVNLHRYVLHLWRPIDIKIPLPPKEFV